MFNKEMSDEEFIDALSAEREECTSEYTAYRRFINGLKLALGY
jgi:hypothetical protein